MWSDPCTRSSAQIEQSEGIWLERDSIYSRCTQTKARNYIENNINKSISNQSNQFQKM